MNNIKSINNINVHSFISFKDKQNFDNANTTPPSLKTNTLIKGLDASANYNKYKKTGQIVIKNENINGMKLYTYEKDGSYTYEEYDKNNNLLFLQSKNINPDGIYLKIIKENTNSNNIEGVQASYKDGNLEHVGKFKTPLKTSESGFPYEEIGYYPKTKTYCIEKADANNNIRMQKFDNNLKPQNP
ncbi:TPA: hypothetical protein CPT92_09100 [Candidatus Gastranaerophilales bacterium HUM_13]|jgi:predicted lipoprotein with Yx(FWY)xxD motif|nr:unknown [Acinetobacter sp. CAG:196]DAB05473.1 MAG TPA: hypothetical protein CPT92_09100 [Candidatus Gastranaerophilales bacterium HUM_13]